MASVQFHGDNNDEAASETREGNSNSNISKPTKRQRWATTRVTGSGGMRKRVSIIDRFHKRAEMKEEKRKSTAASTTDDGHDDGHKGQEEESEQSDNRTIYFNIPVPESERDEEGQLLRTYPRNKIRTSKYTPLTFIPKNVWLQFHNIANVYFLFIIVLNVRVPTPQLVVSDGSSFSPSSVLITPA